MPKEFYQTFLQTIREFGKAKNELKGQELEALAFKNKSLKEALAAQDDTRLKELQKDIAHMRRMSALDKKEARIKKLKGEEAEAVKIFGYTEKEILRAYQQSGRTEEMSLGEYTANIFIPEIRSLRERPAAAVPAAERLPEPEAPVAKPAEIPEKLPGVEAAPAPTGLEIFVPGDDVSKAMEDRLADVEERLQNPRLKPASRQKLEEQKGQLELQIAEYEKSEREKAEKKREAAEEKAVSESEAAIRARFKTAMDRRFGDGRDPEYQKRNATAIFREVYRSEIQGLNVSEDVKKEIESEFLSDIEKRYQTRLEVAEKAVTPDIQNIQNMLNMFDRYSESTGKPVKGIDAPIEVFDALQKADPFGNWFNKHAERSAETGTDMAPIYRAELEEALQRLRGAGAPSGSVAPTPAPYSDDRLPPGIRRSGRRG